MEKLGGRLSYKGDLCTIRYIGSIEPWGDDITAYGVEWDDPNRGKNNGELKGKKYFDCIVPGAGSFIKSSKPHDGFKNFDQAIREKYSPEETTQEEMEVIRISLHKFVESVGMEKVRRIQEHFENAKTLSLARMGVNTEKNGGDDLAPQLVALNHLDLSYNLFSDWTELISLLDKLPELKSVVLNGNRLSWGEHMTMPGALNIKELSLSNTLVTPEDLKSLAPVFGRSLTSLNLSHNLFDDTMTDGILRSLEGFEALESLDLSFNKFQSAPCGNALDKIKDINLSNNFIVDIPPVEKLKTATNINISYNSITQWSYLNNVLSFAPRVNFLRINGNPFYETEEDSHVYVLGRVGQITKLNGTTISDRERIDAELYFISQLKKQKIPGFDLASDRWTELCQKHGDVTNVVDNASTQLKTTGDYNIKDRIIELHLQYPNEEETKLSSKLKVVKTNTLQKTKFLISRQISISPLDFNLRLSNDGNNLESDYDFSDTKLESITIAQKTDLYIYTLFNYKS